MKRIISFSVLALLLASLSACGPEKVSFATLEDARGTARANADWNAKKFRAQMYADWDILGRGDSTQLPECPQGDGWASIDLISPDKTKLMKLKCSTVSANVGCMTDGDFKSKAYANDDGHCQDVSKVPFPLPKIGG